MKCANIVALLFTVCASQLTAFAMCDKNSDYQKISLQGTVTRVEKDVLDKKGEIKTVDVYRLITEDTTTDLPVHKNCQGVADVDLEPFQNQTATVTALGFHKTGPDGTPLVYLHKLLSVRDAGTPGPDSPSDSGSSAGRSSGSGLISIQGRLVHEQKQYLDKTGAIRTRELYLLETPDREIELPVSQVGLGKGQVNLRPHVGQNVTIAAHGFQRTGKSGETLTYVHDLVSVREARQAGEFESLNATNPFSSVSK